MVVDLGVIVAASLDLPPIEHPAASQAGVEIPITALTYGNDCTWLDRTETEVRGLQAIVKPFDRSAVGSLCGDSLVVYSHTASIRFETTGTATIILRGYDEGDRFGTVIVRSSTIEIQ